MAAPSLSVVMPVRNGLPFLDASIASILAQTHSDFEFLILDDASSDGTTERLRAWARRDRRIRIVESRAPLGPAASARQAVEHSSGALVARMDADDVAAPDRLRRQVELFEAKPEAGLCGTLAGMVDDRGAIVRRARLGQLGRRLATPPFEHSTIMFRRSVWEQVGGYRAGHDFWEDIDLYLRMAAAAPVYVIPADLMTVRRTRGSVRSATALLPLAKAYDRMHRRCRGLAASASGKLLPESFLTLATPRLWSGERPPILAGLLRHGDLRANRETLRCLVWAGLAAASPSLLRLLLEAGASLRERRAPARLGQAAWLLWRPRQPCSVEAGTPGVQLQSS